MKILKLIALLCYFSCCHFIQAHAQTGVSPDKEQKALEKAQQIRKELQDGGNFLALAQKYSDDLGSRDFGGKMGFMEKGQLVPEYEAAALALSKGEISEPVKSKYGYHIIQLLEIEDGKFNTRHILIKP